MSYPVNWFERFNAAFVLAITPEMRKVKAAQGARPKRLPEGKINMPLERRKITGVDVRIALGGNSDGPTLLMLCPLPQSIVAFEPIWQLLKGRYNLVALDLPGFGGSAGGEEFMTFEAQGKFLNGFVTELGLSGFHIIGPDVGMSAALHYVTHFDHTVASLIIGDGPGVAPSLNGSVIDKLVNSSFWRTVFTIAGSGPFVEAGNHLGYVNYVPHQAEVRDYVESYKGRIGPITQWFKGYPQSLETVDPLLEKIELPVQIFWGDLDQLLYVDNANVLERRLPRSRLRVFEQCGHYSYQDRADEFAQMVSTWVDGEYQTI